MRELQRNTVGDMTIEHLALCEQELLERVAHLEADRQSYQELAQASIHALAAVTRERNAARRRIRILQEENRALRSWTPSRAA